MSSLDDGRRIQITQPSRRRPDPHRHISQLPMQAITICVAVDRYGSDPQPLGGSNDPTRDLAPIRHQDRLDAPLFNRQ